MADSQPYGRGGIVLGALAVGAFAFALRVALFRISDEPIDVVEALLVTAAVVVTVVVLSLRRSNGPDAPNP